MECAETCQWEVCQGIDRHHLYWPRSAYKTTIEKKFRNLGENIVDMCRNEHNELHATTRPPEVPVKLDMLIAIEEASGVL